MVGHYKTKEVLPMPDFMKISLEEAKIAANRGEVPVGAVLVNEKGEILAQSGNETEALADPTAHAEMQVIRKVAALRHSPRLPDCDLYVTLEPCAMCAAAISFARIRRVIFGAYDPKGGGVEHGGRFFQQPTCHHAPEVIGGVEETACAQLLQDFFQSRR
jgi:tRNA(Arg) A34 adenosine deaminase TadA